MIPLYKIRKLLNQSFLELCEKYKIHDCELLICDKAELIEHDYKKYKYGYLTPSQMLGNIKIELAEKTNSFMMSEYVCITQKGKNKFYYTIILLTENVYKLYYVLNLCKVEYTDEELKEFFLICLQHEVGHIIDFQTSVEKAKDIEKVSEKRARLKYKELKEYFDYKGHLLTTFDEDGPDADYHLCKLEVEKYFNMTAEATANKLAEVDIDRLTELTIKFQSMLEDCMNM